MPNTTSIPPLKILVAEDEKITALHICRLLEKHGHQARHAHNGNEVIEALGNGFFDLIFMDIQMPGMDGLEATRRIRSTDDTYTSIPIIGLSSEKAPPADILCRKAGMNHYMPKPFSITLFEQTFWQIKSRKVFA